METKIGKDGLTEVQYPGLLEGERVLGHKPPEHEFTIFGNDGEQQIASNGSLVSMSVFPDGESRMRKRNAIKDAIGPNAHRIQWLYAELDGVRTYVREEGGRVHIVMTKQDLYP
jgi:hypothetical protein